MQVWYVDGAGALLGSYDGPSSTNPYKNIGTAVSVAPPDADAKWNGSAWVHPKPVLKERAAEKRWRVETAGFTISGITYLTDRESRSIMADAQDLAEETGAPVRWKAKNGHVTLSAADLKAVRLQLGAFIAGLFMAEETLGDLIEAGSVTTPAEIEDWAGWPANG